MYPNGTCLAMLFMIVSFCLRAQTKIQLSLQDISFEDMIGHIEDMFDVRFSYAPELFDDQRISIASEVKDLTEVLDLLEAELEIEFRSGQTDIIWIRPKRKKTHNDNTALTFRVIDGTNNEPLEFVAASLRGSRRGAYSNSDGIISLGMDASDTVEWVDLSLVGYGLKSFHLASVKEGMTITLEREAVDIDEIVVTDRQDIVHSNPEDQNLRLGDRRISGAVSGLAGDDIFRQVQLLPGINAHDESSAGLRIRGDDEDQTLIMLDGIPIYNAGHYYGIFSSINSSYVSTMDLYKNNLPVEYGGKTAGMLNINSARQKALEKMEVTADINLLTASATMQLPLSEEAAVLVSGRSTYGNVSNSPFSDLPETFDPDPQNLQNFNLLSRDEILATLPDFKFNDFNGKFIWNPSENIALDANFYSSNDVLNIDIVNDFFTRAMRGIRVMNREIYSDTEEWSNLGFSLNGRGKSGDLWLFDASMYYTQFDNFESTVTALFRQAGPFQDQIENVNDRRNHIEDYGFRASASRIFGNKNQHRIKAGLDIQDHTTDLSVTEQTREALGIERSASEATLFSSYRVSLDSGFGMEAGLRASYYQGTSEIYYAPRISLYYRTEDNITFKTSAGRHYQFVRELSFENFRGRTVNFWTLSGGQLDPSVSNNLMIGMNWEKGRWHFDVEGFVKEEEKVVEFALLTAPFDGTSLTPSNQSNQPGYVPFEGTGKSVGLDFLVSHTSKTYATWIAYTLSKSTQSFRRILQGREFPSSLDRRHQLKWVNDYRIGNFSLSGNAVYSSGRPYTDIAILDPNLNRDELRPEDRIARLPDYARLDLGGRYHFELGPAKATVGISIYNLLNRQNVKYLQYIFSIPSTTIMNQERIVNTVIGTQSDLLPRTVNLVFSVKW